MDSFKTYKVDGIHFRVYGQGAPLILFHPSPNSGRMFHEFASILSSEFLVICPDTPGYGDSDDLDAVSHSMEDYAVAFKLLFDRLGFKKVSIYGSATGAQISIRYGIMFPDSIKHLYLDNSAHFSDEEREGIYEHYFPDFTPVESGDHLKAVWNLVTNLFRYFPWCFQTEEYKLSTPVPPVSMLHAITLDYLMAGKNYDKAYRAAFEHEKVEYMQELKIPATIFRWKGSILSKYTDRLFEYELPKDVGFEYIAAPRDERFKEMASVIFDKSNDAQITDTSSWDFEESQAQSFEKPEWLSNLGQPPAANESGDHLNKAWKILCDAKICSDAEELQMRMIQWYS